MWPTANIDLSLCSGESKKAMLDDSIAFFCDPIPSIIQKPTPKAQSGRDVFHE